MSRDTRELRLNKVFSKILRPTPLLTPDWPAIIELTGEANQRPDKSYVFLYNALTFYFYQMLISSAITLMQGSNNSKDG